MTFADGIERRMGTRLAPSGATHRTIDDRVAIEESEKGIMNRSDNPKQLLTGGIVASPGSASARPEMQLWAVERLVPSLRNLRKNAVDETWKGSSEEWAARLTPSGATHRTLDGRVAIKEAR
jgi:hypothetical protein